MAYYERYDGMRHVYQPDQTGFNVGASEAHLAAHAVTLRIDASDP